MKKNEELFSPGLAAIILFLFLFILAPVVVAATPINLTSLIEDTRIQNVDISGSPAVVNYSGILYVFHPGGSSNELWYFTFDGINQGQDKQIPDTYLAGNPAPVVYNGKIYCFHNNGAGLYYTVFDGKNWGPDTHVQNVGISGSPAAVNYDGKLYVFHPGGPSKELWCYIFDGINPGQDKQVPVNELAGNPAPVVYNEKLYCFHNTLGYGLYYTISNGTNGGPDTYVQNVGISGSPAAVNYESELCVFHPGGPSKELWCYIFDGINPGQDKHVRVQDLAGDPAPVVYNGKIYCFHNTLGGVLYYTIVGTLPKILPEANFSSNVTNGTTPLNVQFNDSSLNADNVTWDFGDGNNSTEQNPIHTFSAAGNYTVNLTVSNANGTNSTNNTINVSIVVPPTPIETPTASPSPVKNETATPFNNTTVPPDNLKVVSTPIPSFVAIPALLAVLIGIVILLRKKKAPAPVIPVPIESGLDVQIEPASIPADGKSTAVVTIKIKDDKGNFISSSLEKTAELSTTLGSITSPVKIPLGAQAATATITSGQISGTAKVSALSSTLKGEGKVVFAELPKRYCMNCGKTMTMEATNCQECGQSPLSGVDTIQCTTCDSILPQSAKFCDSCGARQSK